MKLAGRISLITGSTSGIGRGVALAFAREGADVVVNHRRQPKPGMGVGSMRFAQLLVVVVASVLGSIQASDF